MKCVIQGRNVKVFAKSLCCLLKIGESIALEFNESFLNLKCMNLSRSAYAIFHFDSNFFHNYQVQNSELSTCIISNQSALLVFKSIANVDKQIEFCKINVNPAQSKVLFKLFYHHGVLKIASLPTIDHDDLNALFQRENASNEIVSDVALFSEIIGQFPSSTETITLATPDSKKKLIFKNFISPQTSDKGDKKLLTEMSVDVNEFEKCALNSLSSISFCLKEFKIVILFLEFFDKAKLRISFEVPGKPIVLSANLEEKDANLTCDFVFATYAHSDISQSSFEQSTIDIQTQKESGLATQIFIRAEEEEAENADAFCDDGKVESSDEDRTYDLEEIGAEETFNMFANFNNEGVDSSGIVITERTDETILACDSEEEDEQCAL